MSLFDRIIAIVAPHQCLGCGREGLFVCAWCRPDFAETIPSRCYRCSAQTYNFEVCGRCRNYSPLKHVWLTTTYIKLPKQLVHEFKFKHARAAAKDIARLMAINLPYLPDYVVVPVPTATRHVRQRGFDHSKLLAGSLAKLIGLDAKNALSKLNQTQQVGTKRAQRIKQVIGSFECCTDVMGQKILLIDDVTTTGATIEEAARVLKRAGAKQIDAAIFAQAK